MSTVPGQDRAQPEAVAARRRLRRLRRAAGLTQEQIAERCGISDRAVRGLESGAVKAPHPATLDSLAGALGLTGLDRESFIASWRDQSTKLSVETLLESLPDPTSVLGAETMARIRRQPGLAEDLMLFQRITMGANRGILANVLYRSIRVLAPLDRWLFMNNFDGSCRPPSVAVVDNCRLSGAWQVNEDVELYEFSFDHELRPGDMYTFGFSLDYTPGRSGPDGRALLTETDIVLAIRELGPSMHMQVEFHPAEVPDRAWHLEQSQLDGAGTRGHELRLSPFRIADLVLEHPRAGLHGITWQWPDETGSPV